MEFQRNKLSDYMSQLLNLSSSSLCELLKPKWNINDATYTFIVDIVDESRVHHVSKVLRDGLSVQISQRHVSVMHANNTLDDDSLCLFVQ